MACLLGTCSIGQPSQHPCLNLQNRIISRAHPELHLRLGTKPDPQSLKFGVQHVSHFGDGFCGHESRTPSVRCAAEPAVSSTTANAGAQSTPAKTVLVAGATGGVGQLVVASLLEQGVQVRAVLRSAEKAKALFGESGEQFQFQIVDCRQRESLDKSVLEGVTHVICCTGTTAFPSKRWDGNNGPEQTDWIAVRNLIDALPPTVEKIVLVSSIGVTKSDQLPWNIMNLFGVLKYKKMGEDHLRKSGKKFTIIRPGRLTDGPYTSYDLNTLLKATAGTRRDVIIGQGDKLIGEASRIIVAEACVKALDLECTDGQTYEISSVEGEGPGKDLSKWEKLFLAAHSTA
ncbi:hypothetical protein R1flu_021390 [Riccia fluitans]|uniref:NAD(P)-binding domain-containing protein n=1 Tax=Riccia fluitans TaxID=41844 RepID=A0ABD1ZPS0_9MARC